MFSITTVTPGAATTLPLIVPFVFDCAYATGATHMPAAATPNAKATERAIIVFLIIQFSCLRKKVFKWNFTAITAKASVLVIPNPKCTKFISDQSGAESAQRASRSSTPMG
jgi:hypothetical protein